VDLVVGLWRRNQEERPVRALALYAGRSSPLLTASQLLIGQVTVAGSGLLVNVLAARSMGPAGRGGLAVFLQVAYLAGAACMVGIDRAYPATVSVTPTLAGALTDVLRLLRPSTLLMAAACPPVALVLFGPALSSIGLAAAVAVIVAGLVGTCGLRTASAAAAEGWLYVRSTVISQASLILLAVLFAVYGMESVPLWLTAYAFALLAGPVTAWYVLRRAGGSVAHADRDLAPARRLGLRLLPASLASMVMLRMDRLLLPWLGSYEQLGVYVVVAAFSEIVVWPVQSYVDTRVPMWHRSFLAGRLRCGRVLAAAAGYGAAVAAGLFLAADLLVMPVFGPAYQESQRLIGPLAAGAALYAVGRVAVGLSLAAERPRAVLAADVPGMVTAVGCYVVLIPEFGAMGAAIGSAIGYGVGAALAVLLCLAPFRPLASFVREKARPGETNQSQQLEAVGDGDG
jgi:O-antigen/teichoic acid export membrane protein